MAFTKDLLLCGIVLKGERQEISCIQSRKVLMQEHKLVTQKQHRGKGYAKSLLKHAINFAKNDGVKTLYGVSDLIEDEYEDDLENLDFLLEFYKKVGFSHGEDDGLGTPIWIHLNS